MTSQRETRETRARRAGTSAPARSRRRRGWRALLALVAGSVLLSGCDFDVYSLPLPGGADVGKDPITVTIMFNDVLDLVPKSSVKVNDVTVGQVTDIKLQGYKAMVTVKVRKDTKLPDNAYAEIQQTSLLGEKFVALEPPPSGADSTLLKTGDVIPLDHTGRNPEVEEVLGALSLVLNGGGVAQLHTIAQEVNQTLGGREGDLRSVLTQVTTLVTTLDQHKADIIGAITALNRLSKSVRAQQGTIDSALEELPSAIKSLDSQRAGLVKMLTALNHLSGVGVRVIKASKQATIHDLTLLQPVLSQFAASGNSFVNAINGFLTYPFVDDVVGRDPQVARNLHVGDYTNLSVQLDVDLSQILGPTNSAGLPTGVPTILPTELNPTAIVGDVAACLASGSLTSAACKKVLGIPGELLSLQKDCQKPENSSTTVCVLLNQVPGGPGATGVPTTVPTKLPTSIPSIPGIGGLGIPGLGRTGQDLAASPHGVTYGQLMQVFDPNLVSLLVPPLAQSKTQILAASKGDHS